MTKDNEDAEDAIQWAERQLAALDFADVEVRVLAVNLQNCGLPNSTTGGQGFD